MSLREKIFQGQAGGMPAAADPMGNPAVRGFSWKERTISKGQTGLRMIPAARSPGGRPFDRPAVTLLTGADSQLSAPRFLPAESRPADILLLAARLGRCQRF